VNACYNPWCDGVPKARKFGGRWTNRWSVECPKCEMRGPAAATEAMAVKLWDGEEQKKTA